MSGVRNHIDNSCSVDLRFNDPESARKFYFDAPGEGYCQQHRCYKCVEGATEAAQQLEDMARRARGVTTITVHWYEVSIEPAQTNTPRASQESPQPNTARISNTGSSVRYKRS